MTRGFQSRRVGSPCVIASYRITSSTSPENGGHPSRSAVAFSNSRIRVGENAVRACVDCYESSSHPPLLLAAVLKLISNNHHSSDSTPDSRYKSISPTPSSSNTDSGHSDTVSSASLDCTSASQQPARQHSAIQVIILPECAPWQASLPVIDFRESEVINIRLTSFPMDESSPLPWDSANAPTLGLQSANPNVVFASPHVLYPHASFSVYRDGETEPIHSEYSQLMCHPPTHPDSGWLYTSALVPGYWNLLSRGSSFRLRLLAPALVAHTPFRSDRSYHQTGYFLHWR